MLLCCPSSPPQVQRGHGLRGVMASAERGEGCVHARAHLAGSLQARRTAPRPALCRGRQWRMGDRRGSSLRAPVLQPEKGARRDQGKSCPGSLASIPRGRTEVGGCTQSVPAKKRVTLCVQMLSPETPQGTRPPGLEGLHAAPASLRACPHRVPLSFPQAVMGWGAGAGSLAFVPPFCCFASELEWGCQVPVLPACSPLTPSALAATITSNRFPAFKPFALCLSLCHLSCRSPSCSASLTRERDFQNASSAQKKWEGRAGPVGRTWACWACSV